MSEVSNEAPIVVGASQRPGERAHSHAHAASGFAGSVSAAFHSAQPHDQSEPAPVSSATAFAASACHFATWNQADAGWRPLRPPKPFVVAKLTISAEPVRRDPDRR